MSKTSFRQSGDAARQSGGAASPSPPVFRAMTILFLLNLLNYTDRYLLAAVFPVIRDEWKLSYGQGGVLATGFVLVYMLASPVFGWAGDRWSRRRLMVLGAVLWSLATAAAGLATGFWLLFLTRALVGVGEASYGTIAPAVISDYVSPARRARALSFFYIAIPVGSAAGYLVAGVLLKSFAWQAVFFVVGLPGLLVALLLYGIPDPPRGASERAGSRGLEAAAGGVPQGQRARPAQPASTGPAQPVCSSWGQDLVELLRCRTYMWNALAMAALTFALGALAIWIPTFFAEYRGIPREEANLWFGGITAVSGLLAMLTGGWLSDLCFARWRRAPLVICAAGMFVGAAIAVPALGVREPKLMYGLIFLAEFFLILNMGPSNAIISLVTRPEVRATAFALNILIIHLLGDAFSPYVVGYVADRIGGLDRALGFLPAVMALSGVGFLVGAWVLPRDLAPKRER